MSIQKGQSARRPSQQTKKGDKPMTTNYETLLATRERGVTREHGGRSESSEDRLFSLQTSISIAFTLKIS
jgi:hypothetical protein